jgi:two-component system NarL family sensor kinase
MMAMNMKAEMAQTTIDNFLQVGNLPEVLDSCRAILKEAREQNDQQSEVTALVGLALVHQYLGKFYEARVYADGGLKSAQALGEPELIIMALNASASVFFVGGFKADEAETDYRAALQLAHDIDNKRGIATALGGIAAVFNHAHDAQRAVTYAREAFDFAREAENNVLMATTLGIMGNGFMQQAEFEKAHKAFDDALELCEQHNIKFWKGYLIGSKGYLLTQDQRYFDEGLEMLDHALKLTQDMRIAPHEFTVLHMQGLIRLNVGHYEIAQDYYETMLTRAQTWKNRAYEGLAFYELGRLHIQGEHYDEAIANFQQAWHISRETMNPFHEAQTEAALGIAYGLKHEYNEALSHYMAARTLYDALDDDTRVSEMTRAIVLTYINRIVYGILRFLGLRREPNADTATDDKSEK